MLWTTKRGFIDPAKIEFHELKSFQDGDGNVILPDGKNYQAYLTVCQQNSLLFGNVMGVEVSLIQITLFQLKKIQQNPAFIDDWFFVEDQNETPPKPINYEELYLGKSWHGLHFVITGDSDIEGGDPPGSYAIFGKHPFEFQDAMLHSCKYLMPNEVKEVSDFLARISKKDLLSVFDPDLMNEIEIYPRSTWIKDEFDSLYDLFREVVVFYQKVSLKNNYVLCLQY